MSGDRNRVIMATVIGLGMIVYGIVTGSVGVIAVGVLGAIVCLLTLKIFG